MPPATHIGVRVLNGERGGPPAYLADGQNEKAIAASQEALELLPEDQSIPEPFKKLVQQNAEGKLQKLKATAAQ